MINPLDLHGLADEQLSPEEAARVREALKSDPTAVVEFNSILNLKDFVKERAACYKSEETWVVCVGRLNELDRARRVEGFVHRYAWGVCAVLFLFVLTGRMMVRGVQGQTVQSADLFHGTSGLIPHQMPVSADAAARDRWLDEVLGQAKQAIDTNRVAVVGGASGIWNGLKVSQLELVDNGGRLKLVIVPGLVNWQDTALMPGQPPVYAGVINGTNCVAWNSHGNSLLLVAQRPYDDLQSVAARIALH